MKQLTKKDRQLVSDLKLKEPQIYNGMSPEDAIVIHRIRVMRGLE